MAEEKRKVAIDADFFRKLTEKDKDGQLFLKIMDELNIEPVMQEYVYAYELNGNSIARSFVKNGNMKVYTYSDYITTANEVGYKDAFVKAYDYFNSSKFEKDVFTYHHEKESLGEIRTTLMAFYMGIDMFMSDDGAAKKFVVNRLSSSRHKIEVYNVFDTLKLLSGRKDSAIKWSDVKGMAKFAFAEAMYKYDEINRLWHEDERDDINRNAQFRNV